jgi:transcriptional regulator with XRE-family HTH domain
MIDNNLSNVKHDFTEEQMTSTKERIKQAMKEAGLTQRSLAAKLGVTNPTVNSFINGNTNPTVTTLKKIAKATAKPLQYFFLENSAFNTGNNSVITINQQGYENLKKEVELLRRELEITKREKILMENKKTRKN